MPALSTTEVSPYSVAQLYALVVDVARYPEFLPWCRAARILQRTEGEMLAELVISFMNVSERYTSRVRMAPHDASGIAQVDVALEKGPFEYLTNAWRFTPLPNGGTEIALALDFKFKSRLLESMIGGVFERASIKMAAAFRDRAAALYGSETE